MTSFKVCLITINALPVKKSMKNAFLDCHIFTEYNLIIYDTSYRCRSYGVISAATNHHRKEVSLKDNTL